MASAYPGLKKIGQFWHYELRVNGHRLHGSTKATDLPTAKKVLEAKRREALEGQDPDRQPDSNAQRAFRPMVQ